MRDRPYPYATLSNENGRRVALTGGSWRVSWSGCLVRYVSIAPTVAKEKPGVSATHSVLDRLPPCAAEPGGMRSAGPPGGMCRVGRHDPPEAPIGTIGFRLAFARRSRRPGGEPRFSADCSRQTRRPAASPEWPSAQRAKATGSRRRDAAMGACTDSALSAIGLWHPSCAAARRRVRPRRG